MTAATGMVSIGDNGVLNREVSPSLSDIWNLFDSIEYSQIRLYKTAGR
jgi:hypothetical protein